MPCHQNNHNDNRCNIVFYECKVLVSEASTYIPLRRWDELYQAIGVARIFAARGGALIGVGSGRGSNPLTHNFFIYFLWKWYTLHRVSEKKTPTHIIGYKLRSSCLILIIFDIKIPHKI